MQKSRSVYRCSGTVRGPRRRRGSLTPRGVCAKPGECRVEFGSDCATRGARAESILPVIKPRTRGKRVVRLITRLDHENNETLDAHAQFIR